MSLSVRLSVALGCVLALASPLAAQQTVDVASVSGRVIDTSGATVPGAQVTAAQLDTNVVASGVTDQDGRFRFPYLRIGPYEITVSLPGFQDGKHRLTLSAGGAYELFFRLPLDLLVEGFNLTDRANVVTRNTNFGTGAYPASPSATFGRITAVGEPRSMQFGARVRF